MNTARIIFSIMNINKEVYKTNETGLSQKNEI